MWNSDRKLEDGYNVLYSGCFLTFYFFHLGKLYGLPSKLSQ